MTGSHFGCGAGECGACNVIVGDHAVTACDTPLWSVADKDVTTIEGLGNAQQPHPLQRAFIAEQALQCGYCVSGILMSAAALLMRNPDPTERGCEGRARPQSLPMRFAQPHGAGGVARGGGDAGAMTEQAPSPSAPKLPPSLAANPMLSSWIRIAPEGHVTVSPGKGRDRARHRDGAGADRRRRTRCRYRPRADGSRLDGGQSQ